MVDDSILRSIKRDLVGIAPDDTAFDQTLINITNSVFTILWELGVGPQEGFRITGNDSIWTDFMPESPVLNLVRSYVPKKVKIIFDTPINGSTKEALAEQIREDEWRLSVAVDPANTFDEDQNE